jgi:hypothetical protein
MKKAQIVNHAFDAGSSKPMQLIDQHGIHFTHCAHIQDLPCKIHGESGDAFTILWKSA